MLVRPICIVCVCVCVRVCMDVSSIGASKRPKERAMFEKPLYI